LLGLLSIDLAREAAFDNVNIDLIVGFPDQDLAEVEHTVHEAPALPVNHFSIARTLPGSTSR